MQLHSLVHRALAALLSLAAAAPTVAQCTLSVLAGGNMPDADGPVLASCSWDPDGNGPQSPVVVFGGSFQILGNAIAKGLALYDPATGDCTTLGTGILGPTTGLGARVQAVAVLPNNDLVVAGLFTSINSVPAANIARWNGSTWNPMGAGHGYAVNALTVLPNGDVVVGGYFGPNGSTTIRWNGTTWTTMNSLYGTVHALAVLPNGDVVAGGSLVLPGNVSLARWNGLSWSPYGGFLDGGVLALRVLTNGDLLVGGGFQNLGGVSAPGIARFDGTNWYGFGAGIYNPVYCCAQLPNGDVVAGGVFQAANGIPGFGGTPANQVARWDGSVWHAMGTGLGLLYGTVYPGRPVQTLTTLPNGDLLGGGTFLSVDGATDQIARWNGASWGPLRTGTGGAVLASADAPNGDRLAVGDFTILQGVAANRVARSVNGVWQALGSGANGPVHAVLPRQNGDVVIAGAFTAAGGVPANRVARWDGANWWPIGGGLPDTVRSLAVDGTGQLLAGGAFPDQIAVWDGQAWNGTGVAGTMSSFGPLRRLLTLPNGDVLGTYGQIGRWNGFGWVPLTTAVASNGPFARLSNGDLVAAAGSAVRRWNGTAWTILGGFFNGNVEALVVLPNDQLLIARTFFTTSSFSRIERWDGTAWSVVGDSASGTVSELRWSADNSVSVCGGFATLFGSTTAAFASLTTSCPAIVTSAGTGCIGVAGVNVLTALSSPWAGAVFTSRATGLSAPGFVVEVIGLVAIAQPLASVLPQGVAGCVLLASPDVLRAHLSTGPSLDLGITIPDTAAWIGASFRQQVVPFELDATGAITAVTATNALVTTVGRF